MKANMKISFEFLARRAPEELGRAVALYNRYLRRKEVARQRSTRHRSRIVDKPYRGIHYNTPDSVLEHAACGQAWAEMWTRHREYRKLWPNIDWAYDDEGLKAGDVAGMDGCEDAGMVMYTSASPYADLYARANYDTLEQMIQEADLDSGMRYYHRWKEDPDKPFMFADSGIYVSESCEVFGEEDKYNLTEIMEAIAELEKSSAIDYDAISHLEQEAYDEAMDDYIRGDIEKALAKAIIQKFWTDPETPFMPYSELYLDENLIDLGIEFDPWELLNNADVYMEHDGSGVYLSDYELEEACKKWVEDYRGYTSKLYGKLMEEHEQQAKVHFLESIIEKWADNPKLKVVEPDLEEFVEAKRIEAAAKKKAAAHWLRKQKASKARLEKAGSGDANPKTGWKFLELTPEGKLVTGWGPERVEWNVPLDGSWSDWHEPSDIGATELDNRSCGPSRLHMMTIPWNMFYTEVPWVMFEAEVSGVTYDSQADGACIQDKTWGTKMRLRYNPKRSAQLMLDRLVVIMDHSQFAKQMGFTRNCADSEFAKHFVKLAKKYGVDVKWESDLDIHNKKENDNE